MFNPNQHRMGLYPYRNLERSANFLMPSQAMNYPERQKGLQSLISRFIRPKGGIGALNNTANTASTLATSGGITSKLDNVQNILKMVQTTAPLVQEYGPMVKNLPAMYRMMKAFKDMENIEETTENEGAEEDKILLESIQVESDERIVSKKDTRGLSQPKLYI
ncbi:VrrA/YqfQ family protein [Virgibacillus halodenitrificans]|uniref:VrrA/YqfQ family protein n=1 Tax=Virgibacillus halodenitrificans TaxID=1482 RepID=UPI0003089DDB|nr:VrrA/YqfQ family protein [Virgibacillus halodenitrificans]MEC2160455.1 VrrA/YqfQ family protein [Virgibacillus halodenitrificans]WHX27297.1 VrrA/YqfQ family protein [Virgibacillus halodenitrificans]